MIPEEVKQKINTMSVKWVDENASKGNSYDTFDAGAEFGYLLAQERNPIDRQELMKLLGQYVGAEPKDVGCAHWSEMRQQLADKIITLPTPPAK